MITMQFIITLGNHHWN